MRTLISLVMLCGMTACFAEAIEDDEAAVGTDEQDIIGGTTDTGDPSVVAIFAHQPGATSGSLCTGTVISARAVLTAAHCVDPRVVGTGNVFEVLPGTTLSLSNSLAVSATAFDSAFNPNNLGGGHDIAVVTLAQPTTLTPIPYNRGALGTGSVRIVGYGSNTHSNTGAGTKRQATTTIASSTSTLVTIGTSNKQTCHGDSGGPAFQTIGGQEVIIGVTSYGYDRTTTVCYNGGVDTRVNAYTGFVDSHL
ncbi:MAG: trypsin-like serine protease [Deltaproteobacteria bacterium]|nr:trypsin-like serine protease [Deltaproteobacteria bacterium]